MACEDAKQAVEETQAALEDVRKEISKLQTTERRARIVAEEVIMSCDMWRCMCAKYVYETVYVYVHRAQLSWLKGRGRAMCIEFIVDLYIMHTAVRTQTAGFLIVVQNLPHRMHRRPACIMACTNNTTIQIHARLHT
jgi:hypothetical protein